MSKRMILKQKANNTANQANAPKKAAPKKAKAAPKKEASKGLFGTKKAAPKK
jgi:hypothetical protein